MKNDGRCRIRKSGESGFAMLLVFLMAAVIAISLYLQLPRVAFEAQRQKEQLLMERGEQYKRAIQLFVKANGRYPTKIDDLENFNNRRFLRHKFIDPITGKSEWRLIHINGAGVFTDSLTNKPKKDDKGDSISTTGSIAEIPDLGALAAQGQPTVNAAASRRRASEGGAATPVIGPDGQPVQPQNTGVPGGYPGQPYPNQAYPGQPSPNQAYPGQPSPNQAYPGQPYPGQNNVAGQPNPTPGGSPDQANPSAQPGYALVNPNPQLGNMLGQNGGAPVPPEVANLPGGAPQPGQQPGQTGQPVQTPPPVQPPQQQFRPPVPAGVPTANSGGQSASGSSSIGGASSIGGVSSSIGGGQSSLGGGSSIGGSTSGFGGNASGLGGNPGFNPMPPPSQGFPQQATQPNPYPSDPGAQNPGAGFGQPNPQAGNAAGQQPNSQAANPATAMINNMLTTPRQQPQTTSTGTGVASTQPGGQTIGGGIAGVASTSEAASIMVYHDKTNYNEWEFIFDYTKQKAAPNMNAGVNGTPVQNMASPQGNATTPSSAFGSGSSLGSSSPFGNTSSVGGTSGSSNTSGFGSSPGAGQGTGSQNQGQGPTSDIRMGAP